MPKPKIGLEVHGYILTKEKLFCRCKAEHGLKKVSPNVNICPVCTAQPGAKPMLPNAEAIKKILQIALMLKCKINKKFLWQRKHYNWPDLPKGYQTTISGSYSIPVGHRGEFFGIRIRECHLEEDPAKWDPETGCVDYNRSGMPLVEIVTEPDFFSSEEVEKWLRKLLLSLSYIKALDKESGIKADVNVSVHGERIEVKNVNSISAIVRTIDYEIERQKKEKPINKETRAWQDEKGETVKMREKESAADYRFIPEPDLPVINIKEQEIKKIKSNLPETPEQKLNKLIKKHKINKEDAEILTSNLELVEFFEKIIEKIPPDFALSWITVELLRVLNYNKKFLDEPDINIKPEHFIELLKLVKQGKITELKAKKILNDFIPRSFSPKKQAEKFAKITDEKEVSKVIDKVLNKKQNQKAISDYKAGEQKAINFLIGDVMKESDKRADFKVARKLLIKKLKD
jgi:aspartyl-tRNA(Asn)/glutamyl-tRNA(Gln) amidotransferase subunit B